MDRNSDLIYEGISSLKENTGLNIAVKPPLDAIVQINKEAFYCITRKNAKNATYDIWVAALNAIIATKDRMVIGDCLSKKVSEELRQNQIN